VAVTTRAYRQAIDLAKMDVPNEVTPQELNDITQVYSRGLGPHFMYGIDHQKVVDGRSPRNRGVRVGTVAAVTSKSVHVEVIQEMKRGDGVVFDAAAWRSPNEPEEGGHIYEVSRIDDTHVKLEFGKGDIKFNRIRAGDIVWRTRDAQLVKHLKPLTQPSKPVHTKPISFNVVANVGQPIAVTATLENGMTASFAGEEPLAAAEKRSLVADALTEKLGRLGGTPYHLNDVKFENDSPVFLPTSQLNQIRRELVDSLFEQSGELRPIAATPVVEAMLEQREPVASNTSDQNGEINLHVLVRSADQLDAAIAANPATITLDYLELYGLRDSVEKVTAAGIHCRAASPRVLKPSEQNIIKFLLSLECDILVRSAGLLKDLVEDPRSIGKLIGDFSLNAANFLSVEAYLAMGMKRITPTYDLNGQQIAELTQQISPDKLEVIAYSHLPVFHMEHCVFCRFLSDGTDSTNCGHPCEKHQISIEDAEGRKHPVMADVGCRNTVFGAEVQFDGQWVEQWWQTGIKDFRVEFVHQTGEQIAEVLTAFQSFFAGTIPASDLETMLNTEQVKTTQGSFFVPHDFKELVELK
ncbi:U32 family peptidase, partial [bacterium]|nr:U32 family peptidase [bacterium]